MLNKVHRAKKGKKYCSQSQQQSRVNNTNTYYSVNSKKYCKVLRSLKEMNEGTFIHLKPPILKEINATNWPDCSMTFSTSIFLVVPHGHNLK